MQDEEARPGVLVATPSAPLEEKLAFRCGEGAQSGAEIDGDALAPAPLPPPPPLPPPVGAYQLPPLPTDDGFDDATRARHRDPLADEDGVVRPDFRPPLAPGSKFDAKYRQWWKLFVFLRTWSAAFNLSQRALESLTKMLTLVCNDHFKVSMSHYITSKVLGLAEPGFIEYAVCGECHKLHAQCTHTVGDDQKPCAHVRRYQRVQSCRRATAASGGASRQRLQGGKEGRGRAGRPAEVDGVVLRRVTLRWRQATAAQLLLPPTQQAACAAAGPTRLRGVVRAVAQGPARQAARHHGGPQPRRHLAAVPGRPIP